MNAIRNRVNLIGFVGQDPEIKTFDSGKKRATLRIATADGYKNNNGDWVDETQWHNAVIWGPLVEVAEKYVLKGSEVACQGKIVYRRYEDKEGKPHHVTEVVIDELLMLGKKGK
ncbi:MAG: single-stranded DNA-binding protein [Bacteroidota bacterium]|jgi:single-strand DNA-binding protein